MNEASPAPPLSIGKLILIPSVITLGITILRLVGELQQGPSLLFNRDAGGGAALIGISWLPLILGPYFAVKLKNAGLIPTGCDKVIAFASRTLGRSLAGITWLPPLVTIWIAVVGLVLFFVASFVAFAPKTSPGKFAAGGVIMLVAAVVTWVGWPALGKTLVAYGYAARIPVVIVMYFAIQGNWGTHYDGLPPNYTGPTDALGKFFFIGFLPQLIFWIVYTLVVGALIGTIAAAIVQRKRALPPKA